MNLSVMYRGPLASCNYGCGYCPFSKRRDSAAQLARDRTALSRFTQWIAGQTSHRWRILFTPWGEALVRNWYREAIAGLSHLPQIDVVAVQTNLSCNLSWLSRCQAERVSLWATYHPTETSLDHFLGQVQQVRDHGVRLSVGVVGVPDLLHEVQSLRHRLPEDVYLWINTQQPRRQPYTPEELDEFQRIDPQFALTARRQPSRGMPCRTGEVSFTVDGRGDMRRCHFVDAIIGNCYDSNWEQALQPRPCPNKFCDCYLGQSQLLGESWQADFGAQMLERIPDFPFSVMP